MAITTTELPEKWSFTLYKGSPWPDESFQVTDESGEPIEDFTTLMQIKRNALNATAIKTLTEDAGFLSDGNKRTFDTRVDMRAGVYVYDIQITLPDGKNYTQYAGTITVKQDVTY